MPELRGLVLAGGEGSRLATAGVGVPTRLVRVAGRPQLERLVETLADLGCPDVTCLVRDELAAAAAALERRTAGGGAPVRVHACRSPSSLHTLVTWAADRRENLIRFTGERGTLAWEGGTLSLDAEGAAERVDFTAALDKASYAGWYSRVLADFADAMDRGDGEPQLREIGAAAAVLERAYAAAARADVPAPALPIAVP